MIILFSVYYYQICDFIHSVADRRPWSRTGLPVCGLASNRTSSMFSRPIETIAAPLVGGAEIMSCLICTNHRHPVATRSALTSGKKRCAQQFSAEQSGTLELVAGCLYVWEYKQTFILVFFRPFRFKSTWYFPLSMLGNIFVLQFAVSMLECSLLFTQFSHIWCRQWECIEMDSITEFWLTAMCSMEVQPLQLPTGIKRMIRMPESWWAVLDRKLQLFVKWKTSKESVMMVM